MAKNEFDKKIRVPKDFSDLHLNVNDVFKVQALSSQNRYPVRLIGLVENQSLIISAPRIQGKEFYLPEGQVLRVRLIADNYACGFQTKVMVSRRVPYLYSHLAYPTEFEAVAVRQASRVNMRLPVAITEAEKGTLLGDWPRNEDLVDVSHTGARIQCAKPLAAVASELSVTFKVVVNTVEKVLTLRALVRNITEVNDPDRGMVYQYGIEFLSLNEMERVFVCAFVYEQMLYQPDRKKQDNLLS